MKIFKFGGSSIKDAQAVKNVVQILKNYQKENPLIVVSALGKTTNALEVVLESYMKQDGKAYEKLEIVKQNHFNILQNLFSKQHPIYAELNDIFVDIDWILEEEPQDPFDYIYDQLVSNGELLSSKILCTYLNAQGMPSQYLDVRDCILTDNTYQNAKVNWEITGKRIRKNVPPLREKGFVITQGFLGGTSENFTTTLGREGSDYTAAIFAYSLGAESMTIWKDVPGVLTGDPRLFKNVDKIDFLSYKEAIEMTYYGAQVIHPKTLRPLQNKDIPLHVKSFIHPEESGTLIHEVSDINYPPIIVIKPKQALLQITSKDFYFVDEERFSKLFNFFSTHQIKVNMTQNTALAFSVCVNEDLQKIKQFIVAIQEEYNVHKISNLKLLTVRHYTIKELKRFSENRKIYLEEQIRGSIQLVLDDTETLI